MEIRFDKIKQIFQLIENDRIIYYNDFTNRFSTDYNKIIGVKKFVRSKDFSNTFGLKVIPSNDCNLKCQYCFSQNDRSKCEKLDFSIIQNTLDVILNKNYKEIAISFTGGGEPTTNFKCIHDIIEYTKTKHNNIHFNLTTNGVFGKNVLDYLEENHVNIAMSIDGVYEIENLQQKETFPIEKYKLIINNVRHLMKAGNEVTALTVLTETTIRNYITRIEQLTEDTFGYLYSLGIRAMAVTFDKNIFLKELDPKIIQAMADFCINTAKWKKLHLDAIAVNRFAYSRNRASNKNLLCNGIVELQQNRTILPNGRYSFCHKVQGDEFTDSVFHETGLKAIVNNDLMERVKENVIKQKKKCKTCIARQTCMGMVCPVMFIENSETENDYYCHNNYLLRCSVLKKAIFN